MRTLAKSEGMAVEPAAAVAFAGLEKIMRQRAHRPKRLVVVNCTGHTFPVEKHVILEEEMVDVSLSESQASVPREGLQAALENLDERTTSVLIVDDNEDDALLIRRLLAGRKAYRIFHARDGWKAWPRPASPAAGSDRRGSDDAESGWIWPGGGVAP